MESYMNETIMQFNYPESVVREFDHWVVMLRPQQVTLGCLVLAAKGEYMRMGEMPAEAFAELSEITRQIEATLKKMFDYDKINYLLLMMRDKYVHFHVFPRYAKERTIFDKQIVDADWPMPPSVAKQSILSENEIKKLIDIVKNNWVD